MARHVHRVRLDASVEAVGALLDALGSEHDRVWPADRWPPMRLEGPPAPGVRGSHGPVRYTTEAFEPGRRLCFRFTVPAGFVGSHQFLVIPEGEGVWFVHELKICPRGLARLLWPLVFGPLHDALARDAIARVVRASGGEAEPAPWSAWVRLLRLAAR